MTSEQVLSPSEGMTKTSRNAKMVCSPNEDRLAIEAQDIVRRLSRFPGKMTGARYIDFNGKNVQEVETCVAMGPGNQCRRELKNRKYEMSDVAC